VGQNAEELRRDIAQTRYELGGTIDAIGDRVIPGRIMERKKTNLAARARSVKERVMGAAHVPADKAHELMGAASDTVHGLADDASSMPAAVKQRAQGAPMAAGAVVFGIGFLIAAAIPPSEKEKELSAQLLDQAEPLKEMASEVGHEMVENLKEPAAEAVADLKDAASGAVKQVSSSASEAVTETTEQAKQAAQTVKDSGPAN
jgi:gas vesicle protein